MFKEILIIKDNPQCEYFCKSCLQLRLSFLDPTTKCMNCDSPDIIKGEIGTLDKEALIKQNKGG